LVAWSRRFDGHRDWVGCEGWFISNARFDGGGNVPRDSSIARPSPTDGAERQSCEFDEMIDGVRECN
jgi:hypothetical protein